MGKEEMVREGMVVVVEMGKAGKVVEGKMEEVVEVVEEGDGGRWGRRRWRRWW